MSVAALRHHTDKDLGDFRFGAKAPTSIHIQVLEAQNLLAADVNMFSDPFCKLAIPSSEEKKITGTEVCPKTLDPVFNFQTTFNFKDNSYKNDFLKIKLYDYDRGSRNDPLGVVVIPLSDLSTIGAVSGWFYLQSLKEQKKGEEVSRSFGRVYIRMIGDKYCKQYEKINPTWLSTRRAQLLDLVRLVEVEYNNTLSQRILFEHRQRQKLLKPPSVNPEEPPPPPPSPLDGLSAYKNVVYAAANEIPSAQLPDPAFYSSSSCFICSPLQHAQLPAVPIDFVSMKPIARLKPMGIDTTAAEITNNDVNVPLIAYKLKLGCFTWNVGNAPPSDPHILKDWLKGDCDIYVVGTQENHYTPRKQFKSLNDDWNSTILAALGAQYVLLQQEDLGQIHIHLYCKRSVKCYVDVFQPKKATEATGFIGVLPNKGGACIAINVLGTSFCFVSAHLAAHAHKAEKRDDDMRSIVKGIQFLGTLAQTSILNAFNHIFFMGDLNYRLKYAGETQPPDPEKFSEMVDLINHQDWETLLATDQLLIDTLEKRTAFVGFNDSPMRFAPTFKVKRGALLSYDSERAPSYCDRVLFKSQDGFEKQVQFLESFSANSVTSSDHKPMASIFNIYPSFPVTSESPTLSKLRFVVTGLSIVGLQFVEKLRTGAGGMDIATNNETKENIDPFVEFTSPCLDQSYKTPPKKSTTTPVWVDDELPTLEFKTSSEGRLWESMMYISVFTQNSLSTRTLIASGTVSFKSEDVVTLIHHHNAVPSIPSTPSTPSTPIVPPSPVSPSSPTQAFALTKSRTGLRELEVHKVVKLFTPYGQEAGILKLKGHVLWDRKDRLPEFQPQNLTSIGHAQLTKK